MDKGCVKASNRLPTISNLAVREIISNPYDMVCVFCFNVVEDNVHLFCSCLITRLVWRKISDWVEIESCEGDILCDHMSGWFLKLVKFSSKFIACIIWIRTCCAIWWTRNQIIFNDAFGNPCDIAIRSIHISWWWLDFWSSSKNSCSYYDWFKLPTDFL